MSPISVDVLSDIAVSDMKTYGIFIPPDGIANSSLAKAPGGVTGEGMGYLYALLMQHSNVKYVTWDEIQKGNANCDVKIFWECRFISDEAMNVILSYMTNNGCLFTGEAPFRVDFSGKHRDVSNGNIKDGLLLQWANCVDVREFRNIDTRDGGNQIEMVKEVGDLGCGEHLDYPVVGNKWTNSWVMNYSLSGATALANFSVDGILTNNGAMAGRIVGDIRHGAITGLVLSKPQNAKCVFEVAKWVGNDSIRYNINLWPEGRPFASFERSDDNIDLTTAQFLYENKIPHVTTINIGGMEMGAAEFIVTHPDYPGFIGPHGSNHTYSFWGSNEVTAEEFAENIRANMAYVNGLVQPPLWTWSSPGYNKGINLAVGIELTPVDYVVGTNPLENLPFLVGYMPYDARIMPYQFPMDTERTKAWYSLINYASFDKLPWKYYDLDGDNSLYDYAESCLYLEYQHTQDFASLEELRESLSIEWAWKVGNRDIWCATPDALICWYKHRLGLYIDKLTYANLDLVTSSNGGKGPLMAAGINIETYSAISSILRDGSPTTNFRYADGRLFIWADGIVPGHSVHFQIEYGVPGPYALCRDPKDGSLSPLIGCEYDMVINDNMGARSFPFTNLADSNYHLIDLSTMVPVLDGLNTTDRKMKV